MNAFVPRINGLSNNTVHMLNAERMDNLQFSTIRKTGSMDYVVGWHSRRRMSTDNNALLSDIVNESEYALQHFIRGDETAKDFKFFKPLAVPNGSILEGDNQTLLHIDYVNSMNNELNHRNENVTTLDLDAPSTYRMSLESLAEWDTSIHRIEYNHVTHNLTIRITKDLYTVENGANSTEFHDLPLDRHDKVYEFKMQIRDNLNCSPHSSYQPVDYNSLPKNERVALETLREMIPEKDYRRYLKRGFVTVQSASGKEYQIFRTKWHTKVRKNGEIVEEICSSISDSKIPLTDKIIAFKSLIDFKEDDYRERGNVYKMKKVA